MHSQPSLASEVLLLPQSQRSLASYVLLVPRTSCFEDATNAHALAFLRKCGYAAHATYAVYTINAINAEYVACRAYGVYAVSGVNTEIAVNALNAHVSNRCCNGVSIGFYG